MAWEHTGNANNVHRYGQEGGKVSASVVTCTTVTVKGRTQIAVLPTYHVTVYEDGRGEIGRVTYCPKRRPNPMALSPRTVARLAKEATR